MDNKNLQQLFDLLDTLPNPVTLNQLSYDDNNEAYDKIIYVNKNFKDSIGYTVEDIPDDRKWFAKAYPEKNYQEYIATEWFKAVEKAKEENSGLTGFPAKVHCKDGAKRWFNITTQLDHPINDNLRTIVFLQTDSPSETQLKLDETSLNLMHERALLQTIIDSSPIRIFWKDMDGVYLGCNRGFLDDAQLTHESEIIGTTDYEQVWKESAEVFREDDKSVRDSGIAKLNYIEEQPQINRDSIILSTSKVPLKDSAGQTIGILGLYQDITQEYKAKEALAAQEELMLVQSKQASMGEMISMIAHQWKQPLTIIGAVASAIQVNLALGNNSEQELDEQSGLIMNQVQYLSQTISDFRDFFKHNKEVKVIKASEIIDDSLLIIGKLLENSSIEFRTSYLSTKQFPTYTNELRHVFINLIKNAADILIENKKEGSWIKVSTYDDDKFIHFEVSDNGGGIDESIIEHIFEPYSSTKSEDKGTGLGLHMSKTIVEKHLNGSISCKNSEEGAVFIVTLPLTLSIS